MWVISRKKERIIKGAWRSDSGISSLDIIVVCDIFFAPRPRELTPLRRFARDIIPWKICGRTLALNVPENVLEIL